MRVKIIVNVILQGCGDVEAAGEESTLSLLHAYLRLVQVFLVMNGCGYNDDKDAYLRLVQVTHGEKGRDNGDD